MVSIDPPGCKVLALNGKIMYWGNRMLVGYWWCAALYPSAQRKAWGRGAHRRYKYSFISSSFSFCKLLSVEKMWRTLCTLTRRWTRKLRLGRHPPTLWTDASTWSSDLLLFNFYTYCSCSYVQLPGYLTTQLCSLRSKEDHLAFSVIWEMDDQANILDVKFCKSVIHSVASLTYDEVFKL